MGRKQRLRRERKAIRSSSNNNEDREEDAGGAVVPAANTAALADSASRGCCLHGSTKEACFVSEYLDAIEALEELVDLPPKESEKRQKEFHKNYILLLLDEEFCKYVFMLAVEGFLQGRGKSFSASLVRLGITIRYLSIPTGKGEDIGPGTECFEKRTKYHRDVQTERGLINCLARETPPSCSCMKDAKTKAKSMDKVGRCFNCGEEFPKHRLLRCSSCRGPNYCSSECQLKHWPKHKAECKRVSTYRDHYPVGTPPVAITDTFTCKRVTAGGDGGGNNKPATTWVFNKGL